MKLHADRVLEEGNSAHVAGRVPRIGALVRILFELAEVWRQQLLAVALHSEVNAVGDKRRRIAKEVNVFVDLLHHFQRKLADQSAVGDQENRNLFVAAADVADDSERGPLVKLVLT